MSDTADESAKAVQEIAKTTGKAIDATSDFGRFAARIIGGSIEQISGMLEDKLRYMRWERQLRLMQRVEDILRDRGLEGPSRPVPVKIAIPLFQEAVLEEDDQLQDIWAALLANAADADSGVDVTRGLISRGLSP